MSWGVPGIVTVEKYVVPDAERHRHDRIRRCEDVPGAPDP
jgi:hypothetical protein